jgi:D-alanine transaminase
MTKGNCVYLNGKLVPHGEAKVSVEDRGFNFGDGIYEVVRIVAGHAFRIEAHLDRFTAGAQALEIGPPLSREGVHDAILEVARANGVGEGTVYVQLTRGAAPREHSFPQDAKPTLTMLARPFAGPDPDHLEKGVAVVTEPDLRWGHCELKTIGLLPNVLAHQRARSAGCYEALFVRDGLVTEGTHTSAFCVRAGTVFTHPIDNLLPSITRKYLIAALREAGVEVEEVALPADQFKAADEILLTGTTSEIMPVVRIDDQPVGSAGVGEIARLGLQLYHRDLSAARAGRQGLDLGGSGE